MSVHIVKANKLAKKALGLFDMAIKGLEKANEVLTKGAVKAECEVADLLQDKKKLEEKVVLAEERISAHDDAFVKNLRKIEKLKELFGE